MIQDTQYVMPDKKVKEFGLIFQRAAAPTQNGARQAETRIQHRVAYFDI
jgi:hypothetical protein